MTAPPARGTVAYEWWQAGAEAEAKARDEGLTPEQRDVVDAFDAMCALDRDHGRCRPVTDTLAVLLGIYAAGLPRRERLRLAWRVAR